LAVRKNHRFEKKRIVTDKLELKKYLFTPILKTPSHPTNKRRPAKKQCELALPTPAGKRGACREISPAGGAFGALWGAAVGWLAAEWQME